MEYECVDNGAAKLRIGEWSVGKRMRDLLRNSQVQIVYHKEMCEKSVDDRFAYQGHWDCSATRGQEQVKSVGSNSLGVLR